MGGRAADNLPRPAAALAAAGSGPDVRNFDLDVARDVGRRISREIAVQWFESSLDGDHNPDREMNALLSDGRCQLVPGYPLTTRVIGSPGVDRSRLPDFDGTKSVTAADWCNLAI